MMLTQTEAHDLHLSKGIGVLYKLYSFQIRSESLGLNKDRNHKNRVSEFVFLQNYIKWCKVHCHYLFHLGLRFEDEGNRAKH